MARIGDAELISDPSRWGAERQRLAQAALAGRGPAISAQARPYRGAVGAELAGPLVPAPRPAPQRAASRRNIGEGGGLSRVNGKDGAGVELAGRRRRAPSPDVVSSRRASAASGAACRAESSRDGRNRPNPATVTKVAAGLGEGAVAGHVGGRHCGAMTRTRTRGSRAATCARATSAVPSSDASSTTRISEVAIGCATREPSAALDPRPPCGRPA